MAKSYLSISLVGRLPYVLFSFLVFFSYLLFFPISSLLFLCHLLSYSYRTWLFCGFFSLSPLVSFGFFCQLVAALISPIQRQPRRHCVFFVPFCTSLSLILVCFSSATSSKKKKKTRTAPYTGAPGTHRAGQKRKKIKRVEEENDKRNGRGINRNI